MNEYETMTPCKYEELIDMLITLSVVSRRLAEKLMKEHCSECWSGKDRT